MGFDSSFSAQALCEALSAIAGNTRRFSVAFSGGADSTALLHALRECQQSMMTDISVRGLHFNHRIHSDADQWYDHCETVCQQFGVPFDGAIWDTSPGANCSEDAARTARYRWFRTMLCDDEVLLTAHHADDQAETVLLNMLEGRGIHRLAGIPARRPLGQSGKLVVRPLLGFSASALRRYLSDHDLDWIEDPSNEDVRYRRNFVRHQILPRCREQFPGCDQTLSSVATRIGELLALTNVFAADAIREISDPEARRVLCCVTPIRHTELCRHPDKMQHALLRHWANSVCTSAPTNRQLDEFVRQLNRTENRSSDAKLPATGTLLQFGDYQMVVHGAHIFLIHVSEPLVRGRVAFTGVRQDFGNGVGVLMKKAEGPGIDHRYTGLHWGWRQGGEQFSPAGTKRNTGLKKLLQAADIPGFERKTLPLLWDGDTLLWVNGLGFSDALFRSEALCETEGAVVPGFFATDLAGTYSR